MSSSLDDVKRQAEEEPFDLAWVELGPTRTRPAVLLFQGAGRRDTHGKGDWVVVRPWSSSPASRPTGAGRREDLGSVMIADRWGVTEAETLLRYGCDDLVHAPTLEAWRGVTVDAEPDTVWSRLRQVRLAPYSYDVIDNFGRRSPRERRDLPEPAVGDPFTCALGRDQGHIVAVEPGRQLTATIMGACMSYIVLPRGGQTRLVVKVVAHTQPWLAPALSLGDLVMARKQLLTLKALAEVDQASSTTGS